MLLMGYRSEVESCHHNCNTGKDWLASNLSSSQTSTSPSSTGVLQPARSTSAVMVPLSALAQVDNSEASISGRGEESCRGAAHLMSGIGTDPSTTFAGAFHAEAVGSAHAFLQDLASAVRQSADTPQHRVLPDAMRGLQLPDGCTGCAALVTKGTFYFVSIGDGLIALSNEAGNRSQTELLSGPEVLSSQVSPDRAMSLKSLAKEKKPAFGSIIQVERSAMTNAADQPVFGTCQLTQTHQFLLLGSGPIEAAMTADQAIEFIGRSRQQKANAAKSASLLAAECNRILTQRQEKETHVAVGVVHFRHPDMMRSFSQQLASQEGSPDSPPRAARDLASLQTSLSPRRVHYLPPFQSTGDEVVLEPLPPSAFIEAATRSPSRPSIGSSSREVPRRTTAVVPDTAGMISSGSLLSRPDMSIPEDHRLSSDSTAMQLPPPLLAPVRKAYPSYGEGLQMYITPEMLSSPSPARKAKIGRAASFNSPDGLWPLPPQRGLAPTEVLVRQSSASQFGARSRGGEEGRVRGGLPRNSSTLSLATPSPTTSPSESPKARTSFDDMQNTVFPRDDPRPGSVFLGRKSHGNTNALRMLLASDSISHIAVKSAPANLSASLSDSLAEPLQRTLTQSSGTESIGHSQASGTSNLSGRCSVRRVPVIDDSPRGLELLSQSSNVSATNMPLRSSTSNSLANDFGGISIGSQVRRTSSDLTSQRWPLSGGVPQAIMSSKSSQERTPSWPDMDSAAPGQGLLTSLGVEGRQHSGMVFQSSSFQDSTLSSFGDSAGSLTNA